MILSSAMHQFPPNGFTPLPSSSNLIGSPTSLDPHHHHHHQNGGYNQHNQPQISSKKRHHPYGTPSALSSPMSPTSASASGPIRRRISRACDQCNQLRTKCDGKLPCQHCIDFTLKCEYARERKKRGKASRKDIQAAQAAAAAQAASQNGMSVSGSVSASPTPSLGVMNGLPRDLPPPSRPDARKGSQASTRSSMGDIHDMSQMHHHMQPQHHHHHLPTPESPSHMQFQHNDANGGMHMQIDHRASFDARNQYQQQGSPNVLGGPRMLPQLNAHIPQHSPTTVNGPNGYGQDFVMLSPHHQHPMSLPTTAPSPMTGLLGQSPEEQSPSWLSFTSPPAHIPSANNGLRYPVLLPVLPHIHSILPTSLACDLLDLYFTNPSTEFFQPASPYVLTHIFRKRSFLSPTSPRVTSPALLCAMLWVAAQTCDSPFLTSPPTTRGRVCQRLLETCVTLLRPLVHVNMGNSPVPMAATTEAENPNAGIGLGGLGGVSGSGREGVGAAGTLDDILTYLHLGTVISASEFKAASLRWFYSAWSLARELRLNREVPVDLETVPQDEPEDHASPADNAAASVNAPGGMGEEEREERRRTWWLLYIVDRHLALCYNRPLILLDVECDGLYLPIGEVAWQNGDFYHDPHNIYQNGVGSGPTARTTGPTFEITGPGLFEFFLPLMTILGEIVDLHHTRNKPRFGPSGIMGVQHSHGHGTGAYWDEVINEITAHLETYERSLNEYERANLSSADGGESSGDGSENTANGNQVSPTSTRPSAERDMETRIVVSYGTHVMHVLHILLSGKWDPISMLDDNDLWISSTSFVSATGHAVSAAEAISNILKYDPDLSFMPYFFGIYLLQGSFLLLLIADKLQTEASDAVVTACETIVRAHEVCVVTLNTEYQRNFRKVMRSALSQVRGRGLLEDMEEQKLKRREVLALYRWCGDGTGLAL